MNLSEPQTGPEIDPIGSEPNTEGLPGTEGESQQEQAFYAASDVPEALRPTFREMQAALTRKTQEVSEQKKVLARDREQLQATAHRAQLFDTVMADPRVRTFLQSLQDSETEGDPETSMDGVSSEPDVQRFVKQAISPLQQKLTQLERQAALTAEREAFLRNHPDFDQEGYRDELERIWTRNPSISMEDAYAIASHSKAQRARAVDVKKTQAAKATVEKPGTSLPASSAEGPVKSFSDAVNKSLRELGFTQQQLRGL